MSNIDAYIKALSAVENAPEIVTERDALSDYVSANCSRMPVAEPLAIVYPTTTEQVESIVKLANEHQVALVVRSSGGKVSMNGSSLPADKTSCVAVNLSRMNKVRHIDAKNMTALIEAGVTYGQLNEALKPYGLYIEHPLLPRAEKSVVASLLDREPVMTPKHVWDVPDPLCCVEMVMGNGALFRSGSAAGPGTIEDMIESGVGFSQAQGPVWLDLGRVITGAQGTLSTVTWVSVKVRPIGSISTPAFVQSDDADAITEFASMMIRQRLGEETLILNRKGLAQVMGVEDSVTAKMPKWTLVSTVRGFRFFPERYMDNQLADMEDIAKGYGLTILRELKGISKDSVYAALQNTSEPGAYWKQRYGNGILDLFTLSTMDKLASFAALAEATVARCGLSSDDLCIYAQPSQMGRNCHIEFIINADADTADKVEAMLATALLDSKAFFSRPYGKITQAVFDRAPDHTAYLPHIKLFFDENQIMNPGRLVYDGGRK